MVAFYNQGDQDIYNSGIKFRPQQKYLLNDYTAPTAQIKPVPTSSGITNTNAFNNSGGGGALQVGDPMMNFKNYYNYTGDKYMQNQDTPNVDMNYDQKLQSNFMGFPSYRQQELTGADMGEYIGSNTDIPLEQTMAGKIQSGLQSAGGGLKGLMQKLPTPGSFLNRIGVQNFNSLSPADQLFIKTNTGYRGPTVFGENTGGGNVDPFGLNTESLTGNYAGAVRDNFSQLKNTLTKDRPGVTFNEVTGKFEGEDENLVAKTNKQTNLIRNKFLFRQGQMNQQGKNEADITEKDRKERERVGAVQGLLDEGSYVSRDSNNMSSSDRAVGGGAGVAGLGSSATDRGSKSEQGYSQHAKGGRVGYFFGGRVNFKDGGLASIL